MIMSYFDLIANQIVPLYPIPTGMSPAGKLREPVCAVIFDVYGTIIVSQSGDISIAKNQAQTASQLNDLIENYGYQGNVDDLIHNFFGLIAADHGTMRQKGIDYPEVEIDHIWRQVLGTEDIETARRFAIQFEMIVNPGYLMPQLTNVLSALRNSGMHLGIISNAQFFTPLLFQVLCGDSPENIGFEAGLIFYSYQHGVAKPSRRLFHLAARALKAIGIEPENTIYVGNDMLNDILPATAEGFQTALFAGDKRSLRLREDDPRCQNVNPDLIITELPQLVNRITTGKPIKAGQDESA